MSRTRALPLRKTHGTAYNLSPATQRVPARALRIGDVVLEGPDHPATVTRIAHRGHHALAIYAKYIWQPPYERAWLLGEYALTHPFDRALPGEYPAA